MTPFQVEVKVVAPANRAELQSLVARRDELKEQLTSLNSRREMLADQVERLGSSAETRAAPVARLRETDARIARVETELNLSDEAIAAALAKGLGRSEVDGGATVIVDRPLPEIVTHIGEPSWPDRAMQQLDTTLPITLGAVLLLGALLYWRIAASMKSQFARMMSAQSSRLEEIQRSVDTVAVEVERVSENQRFVTKLVGDRPVAERR